VLVHGCTSGTAKGTPAIDAREIHRLVAKGEGKLLEFKPGAMRPTELASSLAAFANADGGLLLLGIVEQPDGTPTIEGVRNRKVAIDHLYTAAGLCSPKVELSAPEEIDVDGKLLLAVTIPGGLRQIYSAEGRYVVREGSFRRSVGRIQDHFIGFRTGRRILVALQLQAEVRQRAEDRVFLLRELSRVLPFVLA